MAHQHSIDNHRLKNISMYVNRSLQLLFLNLEPTNALFFAFFPSGPKTACFPMRFLRYLNFLITQRNLDIFRRNSMDLQNFFLPKFTIHAKFQFRFFSFLKNVERKK